MKYIYLDADGVIMNTNQAAINYYNEKTNSDIKIENIKEFSFLDIMTKWDKEQINSMFVSEEFFEEYINPIDGCIETLQKLKNEGYRFKIVTIHNPRGIIYKDNWIKRYLGDLIDGVIYITFNTNELVMKKDIIQGFILLDDNISCLKSCVGVAFPICFGDYNYNKEGWNGRKANNWDEFYKIVKDIDS